MEATYFWHWVTLNMIWRIFFSKFNERRGAGGGGGVWVNTWAAAWGPQNVVENYLWKSSFVSRVVGYNLASLHFY